MRIGLFTDTYEPDINGVVSSIVTLQNALEKLGHEVFVITNHNKLTIERVGNVLFLPGIEIKRLYGYTMSSFYSFKGKNEIKSMNLDIIHVHTEFGVGIFARMIAKLLKIPIVATYHTAYEDYTHYVNFMDIQFVEKYSKKLVGKISKLYSNAVNAVVAPSFKTKEMLERYGVQKPIYEIPTGLNLSRFDDIDKNYVSEIRKYYHLEENENLAIFVGRIAPEKNITMIIEAFKFIDDVKLMIVGGGPQLEELKSYAKQLQVEDKIIFTDKKENQFIPQYYACASCFVSASTSETQGMTYIEALAAKKVVFARRDEVVKNLIVENKNGYLFDDAYELANKMKQYFTLSEQQRIIQQQYCKDSVTQYDDLEFGKKVIAMYEDVVKDKIIINDVRFEKDSINLITNYEEIRVDLDTYLEYHLAKGKEITSDLWNILLKNNKKHQAYASVIRKLNYKSRTEKEVKKLLEEFDLDKEDVDNVIQKLKAHRLLDDQAYLEAYLNSSKIAYYSNQKVREELREKGIIIEFVDRDENEIALQYGKKILRSTQRKSLHQQKNYIRTKMYQEGFLIESISFVMSHLVFELDENKEKVLLDKIYQKALKMYGKYSGYERERRIRLYLKSKGFNYDELEEINEN